MITTFEHHEQASNRVRVSLRHDAGLLTTLATIFVISTWWTVRACAQMSMNGMSMPGGWNMSMAWMRMPGQTWPEATASFMGMWTVMMAAMMVPCAAPMLLAYRRADDGSHGAVKTLLAAAGYGTIWILAGALAYALGIPIAYAEMRHDALSTAAPWTSAVLVLIVGAAQFSGWKRRRLARCRVGCAGATPNGMKGAFRHGLQMGIGCGRCCGGLMLILLVTDVMNLGIMAAVTVAVTAERLLPNPAVVSRIVGVVVIAAGISMLCRII